MANREVDKNRDWRPVRDQAADGFWVVLIASMSLTVLFTRVFLELTGYPQVGDSTFHIAHVLWGGLLLFVAVALPISLANRYAEWAASVLGGIGAGLFIDEVGKFITQSNDYFYPLAFPIIYGFILICVWLYFRIRRHQPRDTRTLLYHAVEDLKQVIDNDLDPFEHRELVAELQHIIAHADDPNERGLAQGLLSFAQSRDVRLALQPNPLERMLEALRHRLSGWPPRLVLKLILIIGFGLIGLQALLKLVAFYSAVQLEGPLHDVFAEYVVVSGKSQYTINNPTLMIASNIAVIGIGLLALLSSVFLLAGRERTALRAGVLALVIALAVVNLFTFYFNQLFAVVEAAGQVILLAVASVYRWRFLGPEEPEVSSPQPA
jgi:hypothetical protein